MTNRTEPQADALTPTWRARATVLAAATLTSVAGALAFPRLRNRVSPSAITTLSAALLGAGRLLIGTAGTVAQAIGIADTFTSTGVAMAAGAALAALRANRNNRKEAR